MNMAVRMRSGVPAILSLTMPKDIVTGFLENVPPLAREVLEDAAVEFLPGSFARLNASMTSLTVQTVEDFKFEE
jgi:hypothetical protein